MKCIMKNNTVFELSVHKTVITDQMQMFAMLLVYTLLCEVVSLFCEIVINTDNTVINTDNTVYTITRVAERGVNLFEA